MNHAGESPLISPTHPLRGLARPPKADEGPPEPRQGDGPDPQLLTGALGLVSPSWRQAFDEAARKAAEPGFEEELQAALEREAEKARAAWEAAKAEAGKAAPAEGPKPGTAAPVAPPPKDAGGPAAFPSWWLVMAVGTIAFLAWLRRRNRPAN
jgi:hypothetical protein